MLELACGQARGPTDAGVYETQRRRGRRMVTRYLTVLVLLAGMIPGATAGQEKTIASADAGLAAYDATREVALTGMVHSFTSVSETVPLGAHVVLQTSSGLVDVHMGDARLLAASHFAIQRGDTLRIIGEKVAYASGTQFVARIVQRGTQVLAVRSVRGIPLSYMAARNGVQAKSRGGTL